MAFPRRGARIVVPDRRVRTSRPMAAGARREWPKTGRKPSHQPQQPRDDDRPNVPAPAPSLGIVGLDVPAIAEVAPQDAADTSGAGTVTSGLKPAPPTAVGSG